MSFLKEINKNIQLEVSLKPQRLISPLSRRTCSEFNTL